MADAVRSHTITVIPGSNGLAWVVSWEGLDGDDSGDPIELSWYSDRSVQIIGTFDTTTVLLEGSNDGATWATLTDPQGNALSKTAAALEAVAEATRYIRPRVSAGGASTDIDVYLFVTGGKRV